MKNKMNKAKNPVMFALFTAAATFAATYIWMIILHVGVEVYEVNKFGSRVLAKTASEQLFNSSTILNIVSYIVLELIIVFIACFRVKRYNEGIFRFDCIGMKWGNRSFKQITDGFIIVFIIFTIMYMVMTILGIVKFVGYGFENQSPLKAMGTIILIFILTSFPGFCEEIVFRGVIQNYLMKKMSTPLALIISSTFFSIMHIGRYNDFLTLFIIIFPGVVFGYIFAKSKSLYLPIGLHFAWDFLASIMGVGKSMFNTNYILVFQNSKDGDVLSNLVAAIAFLLLFIVLFIKYRFTEGKGITLEG